MPNIETYQDILFDRQSFYINFLFNSRELDSRYLQSNNLIIWRFNKLIRTSKLLEYQNC